MTEFAGFQMPVQYTGIIEEHLTVRSAAGLFDLCHMGEFELRGPGALGLLERALTNSAAGLKEGQAQYTLMCAEDGGTVDDLIVYRIGTDRYMLCVNASNTEADRRWLQRLNRAGAEFRDLSDETALVAIQGPKAAAILGAIACFPIAQVPRFAVARGEVGGVRCVAARTGYTGEDGFELFTDIDAGVRLFEAILQAGSKQGLKPCGFGARDTLRVEAALPLYGHELDRSISPLQAGLGAFVKFDRGFVGERALAAQRLDGPGRRLIGLVTDDRRTIARQGYRVFAGGREVGAVTSGTFAPWLKRPVAMAYVDRSAPLGMGAEAAVEVRSRIVPATVVAMPFYRRKLNRDGSGCAGGRTAGREHGMKVR
jgi:glycine cleavage system T protein (aminomethyltransferase)